MESYANHVNQAITIRYMSCPLSHKLNVVFIADKNQYTFYCSVCQSMAPAIAFPNGNSLSLALIEAKPSKLILEQ